MLVDDWQEVVYDFLINGIILRTTLEQFIADYSLFTESVIPIECVEREPVPAPETNIPDTEWVSAVKVCTESNM